MNIIELAKECGGYFLSQNERYNFRLTELEAFADLIIKQHQAAVNKQEFKNMYEKLAIAIEALERIVDPHNTGEHLIAEEALNKIRSE